MTMTMLIAIVAFVAGALAGAFAISGKMLDTFNRCILSAALLLLGAAAAYLYVVTSAVAALVLAYYLTFCVGQILLMLICAKRKPVVKIPG